MARNEGEGGGDGEAGPGLSSSSRIRAGPDPFLVVCRCFSFVTALVGILCIAVNVLSAVRSFKNGSDVCFSFLYTGISKIYVCLCEVLIVN